MTREITHISSNLVETHSVALVVVVGLVFPDSSLVLFNHSQAYLDLTDETFPATGFHVR